MSIDERHQRRWRTAQARRQKVRDVFQVLQTYSPHDGEDAETFRHRLARQNHLHELEMDAREDVANDDDAMCRD